LLFFRSGGHSTLGNICAKIKAKKIFVRRADKPHPLKTCRLKKKKGGGNGLPPYRSGLRDRKTRRRKEKKDTLKTVAKARKAFYHQDETASTVTDRAGGGD